MRILSRILLALLAFTVAGEVCVQSQSPGETMNGDIGAAQRGYLSAGVGRSTSARSEHFAF